MTNVSFRGRKESCARASRRQHSKLRLDVHLKHGKWLLASKDGHLSEEALEGSLRLWVQDVSLRSMLKLRSSYTIGTRTKCLRMRDGSEISTFH